MFSSRQLFNDILAQIAEKYELQEARSIVFLLLQHYLKLSKTAILIDKAIETDFDFTEIIQRLNQHEPIQYIMGETEFYGLPFRVNPAVLIPRPETEELVQLIIEEAPKVPFRILDMGTGSGCIAISLAHALPHAQVKAIDISEKALETARENATLNGVNVTFEQKDILNLDSENQEEQYEIIVSNPPYVTRHEAKQMQANVLDFEPHLALFLENDNALIFYEKIAQFGKKNLAKNGKIYVEINEHLGKGTAAVFKQLGYSKTKIIKDLSGKERILLIEN